MPQPKYQFVQDYIMDMINDGSVKIGEQIPTEEQLCTKFNYSRMTINKALNLLSDKGFITRIPGKGSFVTSPHVVKDYGSASSFTEDMKRIGLTAGSKLLSYKIIKAKENDDVAQHLQLKGDDLVHYFVRLRTGDDKPIAVSYTYIAAKIIPAIDVSCLSNSFYQYVKSLGLSAERCTFEMQALMPTEEEKKLLHITNTAILCSTHVTSTYIEGNYIPFEYIHTHYNGDVYTYSTEYQEAMIKKMAL